MIIREKLRQRRKKLGFSRRSTAIRAGLSDFRLAQIENEEDVNPTIGSIEKICNVLGLKIDVFIADDRINEDEDDLTHYTSSECLQIENLNNNDMTTNRIKLDELNSAINALTELGLEIPEKLTQELIKYEGFENLSNRIQEVTTPLFEDLDEERVYKIIYSPVSGVSVWEIREKNNSSDKSNIVGKKIKVIFPDGTEICESRVAYTLVNVIKCIGWEKVAALKMQMYGIPLVGSERSSIVSYSRSQFEVAEGVYVLTNSQTQTKYNQLKEISERLNLDLKIELI